MYSRSIVIYPLDMFEIEICPRKSACKIYNGIKHATKFSRIYCKVGTESLHTIYTL